ncbi:MAG: 2-dehydropantoate 2-reductase [Acidobacteriota bacterium]
MRFLVAGAGAIGAYVGARLARSGEDVTLFARGAHLAAMRDHGVRVVFEHAAHAEGEKPEAPEEDFVVHPRVIGNLAEAGELDVIILGVKAHGLTGLAPSITPLIGPNTTVLSTQNGIPWWYFQADTGEFANLHLESVDPGGVIGNAIPYKHVAGSLVYFATDLAEPGVVRHIEGNRITLGEPDGTRSDRIKAIAEALIKSGLRAPVTTRLRGEIFVKLLGNAAFNPLSALTRATLVRMARDPDLRALVVKIMTEVETIGTRLGIKLPISIDQRIAGAEAVGEHKTSMLQDVELGRPIELECIAGALVELGRKLAIPTPHLDTIYASTKLLGVVAAETRK